MDIVNNKNLYSVFSDDEFIREITGKSAEEILKNSVDSGIMTGNVADPIACLLNAAHEKYESMIPNFYEEISKELAFENEVFEEDNEIDDSAIFMRGWYNTILWVNERYMQRIKNKKFVLIPNKERIDKYNAVKAILRKIAADNPGSYIEEDTEGLSGKRNFFLGVIIGDVCLCSKEKITIKSPSDLIGLVLLSDCKVNVETFENGFKISVVMGSLMDEVEINNVDVDGKSADENAAEKENEDV